MLYIIFLLAAQSCPTLSDPMDCSPPRLLCPWNSPGKNATIIMVSHSMSDVARLTDRLIVMDHAKVAMDGTPAEVFTRAQELVDIGLDIPELTRVFLKLQAMGLDVPAVYTMEQAVEALVNLKEGK